MLGNPSLKQPTFSRGSTYHTAFEGSSWKSQALQTFVVILLTDKRNIIGQNMN